MSPENPVNRSGLGEQAPGDQLARDARARSMMSVVIAVVAVAAGVVLTQFVEDSPIGRTALVLSTTLFVLAIAALALYALNRRLPRDTGASDAAASHSAASDTTGPADLVALASILLPVFAVVATLVTGRPYELLQLATVMMTLAVCLLLCLVAVATRRAARQT